MNTVMLKEDAIYMAARLTYGNTLKNLQGRCATQKTISTRQVQMELDKTENFMRVCAKLMRMLSDQL